MNALTSMAKTGCGCGCGGSCNGTCGSTCQTETMVRPLFFAGQLLTEDDLQQLEDYVIAKNRLHNRYLFGEGVVCGFEVLCDPCGPGRIMVRPGYALDCCGNDLVLTCPTTLDVNAMIRDLLRDLRGGIDCGDPCTKEAQTQAKSAGKVPLREYCLTVQYCEQKTDPVSPYATDAPCSPMACEPSRVREGVRFALRCPEQPERQEDFFAALACCFEDLLKLERIGAEAEMLRKASFEQRVATALAALRQRSFEEVRRLLLDLIDRSPHPTACTLRARVLSISPPPPARSPANAPGLGAGQDGETPIDELIEIFLELLRECLCIAFLPRCPPCDCLEVELACIRVRGCDVVEICNLSREFVLSPAALRYWFGFGRLERELRLFCCPEEECPKSPKSLQDREAEADARATTVQSPELPAEALGRAGRVLQDVVRAMALLATPGSPEAPHLGRLAELIGELASPEPEPKPDLHAELDVLRKRVDALEQQPRQATTRQRPAKPS